MHELGIARDLFEIVLQKATDSKLKKITKISVKLAEASGIEKDFLQHAFEDHLFPNSIASGCELELIVEKVQAKCKNCAKKFTANEIAFNCPFCSSSNIEIISCNDVYITSIEGE